METRCSRCPWASFPSAVEPFFGERADLVSTLTRIELAVPVVRCAAAPWRNLTLVDNKSSPTICTLSRPEAIGELSVPSWVQSPGATISMEMIDYLPHALGIELYEFPPPGHFFCRCFSLKV